MLKKLFALLFITSTLWCHKYEVGICAIFRDEGRFLKEWIEYHRLIGVEHFYLYNHNSRDNYMEVLAPYIKEGIVELEHCNVETNRREWVQLQKTVYRNGAKRALHKCKWLAFIDLDEFIFPVEEETLPLFLQKYEDYDGLVINWQIFGTSHIALLNPKKLMIEQLIYRAETDSAKNHWIKTIAKPESLDILHRATEKWSAHLAQFKKGHYAVNANFEKITATKDPTLPIDKIHINHYITRDEENLYNNKLKRPNNKIKIRQRTFDDHESYNAVEDTSILRYAPALEEAVFGT